MLLFGEAQGKTVSYIYIGILFLHFILFVGLIKQFLKDVYWQGGLDYLVVDTPPGTSDEHLSTTQYLKAAGDIGHAIIVTTPQVCHLLLSLFIC